MKNTKLICIALIALSAFGCSKTKHYQIQGSLGTLNSPATVYLLDIKDQAYVVRDSAILENGKFMFDGETDSVTGVQIVLNREGTGYEGATEGKGLFLEDGVITIKDSSGSLRGAIISGTPNNDAQLRFHEEVTLPLNELHAELAKKQQEATPEMLDDEAFTAELTVMEQYFNAQLNKLTGDFVYANPDVLVSLYQLMGITGIESNERVEYLYNNLSDNIRQSPFGQELGAKIERLKLFEVGATMPEITLPDTGDMPVSSSDFEGQYLLIDLWAAWCAPCRAENPNLVALYNKYKNRNFNILGISLDESKEEWLAAIQKDGLTWTQVSDLKFWESAAVAHFGIASIPTNYLIDSSGKIIARDIHGQALRNKLEELLEKGI